MFVYDRYKFILEHILFLQCINRFVNALLHVFAHFKKIFLFYGGYKSFIEVLWGLFVYLCSFTVHYLNSVQQ